MFQRAALRGSFRFCVKGLILAAASGFGIAAVGGVNAGEMPATDNLTRRQALEAVPDAVDGRGSGGNDLERSTRHGAGD